MVQRDSRNIARSGSNSWVRRRLTPLLCVMLLAAPADPGSRADDQADIRPPPAADGACVLAGFTSPFQTTTLATVHTGRISAIPVEEGDVVQAGDLTLQLDDSVQRCRVAISKAYAESTLEIDLARVDWEEAVWELDRLEKLNSGSFASEIELHEARSAEKAAKLTLEQAEFKHAQSKREYLMQQAVLDELRLKAPFAGYIAERLKEVGDTVEEREGILTLVQLDPLVVALDCPLEFAANVRPGGAVRIRPAEGGGSPRDGEIFFINRVADPASQTFKVKILIPNGDNAWIAGMRVSVSFENQSSPAAGDVKDVHKADASASGVAEARVLAADKR